MPSGGHQIPPGVHPSSNGCHSMPHEVHPIHEVKTEILDGFSIEEQSALEIVEDLPMPKHHGGHTMLDGGRDCIDPFAMIVCCNWATTNMYQAVSRSACHLVYAVGHLVGSGTDALC